MKAAFDGKHFTDGDVKLSDGREFGASAMLHDLARLIDLNRLIYSRLAVGQDGVGDDYRANCVCRKQAVAVKNARL
jgi:hypothetical protein